MLLSLGVFNINTVLGRVFKNVRYLKIYKERYFVRTCFDTVIVIITIHVITSRLSFTRAPLNENKDRHQVTSETRGPLRHRVEIWIRFWDATYV